MTDTASGPGPPRSPFPALSSELLTLGAGTFCLVLLHSIPLLSWPYADWAAASAETRQALSLAGPWVAVCSCWIIARRTHRHGVAASPVASRMGHEVIGTLLIRIQAAALAGYALGLLPMVLRMWRDATAGAPHLLTLAGSLACLLLFACGGCLIGAMLPLRGAVLTAAVASFLVIVMTVPWGPVIAPVWQTGVVAGQEEDLLVGSYRLFFFSISALCCALAAGWWLELRGNTFQVRSLAGLAVLSVPLGMALILGDVSRPAVTHASDPPQRCARLTAVAGSRSVVLCLHGARSAILPEAITATQSALDAAGPLARSVRRIVDVNLWEAGQPGLVIVQIQPQDAGWEDYLVEDLAFSLSGSTACAQTTTGGPNSTRAPTPNDISAGFGIWIAERGGASGEGISTSPGARRIAGRLSELQVGEVHDVMTKIAPSLMECEARSVPWP